MRSRMASRRPRPVTALSRYRGLSAHLRTDRRSTRSRTLLCSSGRFSIIVAAQFLGTHFEHTAKAVSATGQEKSVIVALLVQAGASRHGFRRGARFCDSATPCGRGSPVRPEHAGCVSTIALAGRRAHPTEFRRYRDRRSRFRVGLVHAGGEPSLGTAGSNVLAVLRDHAALLSIARLDIARAVRA